MDYPQGRLILFCKEPQPGAVKTRLEPELGQEGCLQLHHYLCRSATTRLSRATVAPLTLQVAGNCEHPFFKELADAYPLTLEEQKGRDVGERMAHAISTALESGAQFVLLTGGDVQGIERPQLIQSASLLEQGSDVVVIPAEDGGFGLIGARRWQAGLFDGIEWGTDSVMQQLSRRLDDSNLKWNSVGQCWDVDRPEDLIRLGEWR